MDAIKPIRSDADHAAALARIDALMGSDPGTPEGDELDVLVDLVEHHEAKTFPVRHPSPIEAIRFRMDQAGLAPRDLVPFLGSRAKVSEVLAGTRRLTLPMVRALHLHLGIPAESLLGPPTSNGRRTSGRTNAMAEPAALRAWRESVVALVQETRVSEPYRRGTVTPAFLRRVARQSPAENGPRLARDFLGDHGIPLVVAPPLPRTHLDGAALEAGNSRPVVALTLREDRLDEFWFCLLHELAHVGRHLGPRQETFFDDLGIRGARANREENRQEREADEWAEEALIPGAAWKNSAARRTGTTSAVIGLASELHIHPAIVARRIRRERRSPRLLSHFVGRGEVRRQLASS
ncbi:MAG: ImmA/IrrE family metallo-endopeptidase [Deltaproteobacteria bacterium]|nr:ImmA/IrrE family metallo-endopeptidase [Deltaproteobacteria bacterium]